MTKTINLYESAKDGHRQIQTTNYYPVHNLSGRALGEIARCWAEIDKLDETEDTVKVVIPDHIYSISPSFFLGMFEASVHKLKSPQAFFEKYQFTGPVHALEQIEQGVDRAIQPPTSRSQARIQKNKEKTNEHHAFRTQSHY